MGRGDHARAARQLRIRGPDPMVDAVERYAARITSARVIVLPGDSFHIAAVEPDVCAQHALRFMAEVSQPNQTAGSREAG